MRKKMKPKAFLHYNSDGQFNGWWYLTDSNDNIITVNGRDTWNTMNDAGEAAFDGGYLLVEPLPR